MMKRKTRKRRRLRKQIPKIKLALEEKYEEQNQQKEVDGYERIKNKRIK